MAYYVPVDAGPDAAPLAVFPPSFGESTRSAVAGTFSENPSVLLWDYGGMRLANRGEKLSQAQAQEQIRGAGVKLTAPDDGYTQEALSILIGRQQDAAARQAMDDRTPWGFQSLLRGSAQLMAGVVDPLNIASAFVPVVGEARAARWLAQAGEGFAARTGARAAIGGIEGAAGAAMLEPLVFATHSALQDDYHMTDSLVNLAFGTALGGVLHAGAGGVGDLITGSARRALSAELDRVMPGLEAREPALATEIRRVIDDSDLASLQPAPFTRRGELTSDEAREVVLAEMRLQLREQLLAEAGNRAQAGDIPRLRSELSAINGRQATLASPDEFKRLAKEAQGRGLSRKQAEAEARKDIASQAADADATAARIKSQLDTNAAASLAEQDIAVLDGGGVPERFARQVEERAAGRLLAGELVRSLMTSQKTPAAFIVGMAGPEKREIAMRSAIADMAQGRSPAVEHLIRGGGIDQARAVAAGQSSPDSLAIGSYDSSRAAAARLEAAPKDETAESAKALMAEAEERMQAVKKNLELGGYPASKLAQIDEALKAYDEGVKDAKGIGNALQQYAICGMRQ